MTIKVKNLKKENLPSRPDLAGFNRVGLPDGSRLVFHSLTLAWAEVCGRSYGGGVLELEPREAEELPIPYSDDIEIDIVERK